MDGRTGKEMEFFAQEDRLQMDMPSVARGSTIILTSRYVFFNVVKKTGEPQKPPLATPIAYSEFTISFGSFLSSDDIF